MALDPQERIIKNNETFRQANDQIRAKADAYDHDLEQIPFLCECPTPECVEIVRLTPAEYAELRSGENRFMTAVGHEGAEKPVGHVVSRNERYVVIEKERPP
jgi:hypothetical protein